MKVYTEVVYTWDDNKGELVEESSKSFDYEGPIVSCHWYHRHSKPPAPKIKVKIKIPTITFPKPPPIVVPKINIKPPPVLKPPSIVIPTANDLKGKIESATGDAKKNIHTQTGKAKKNIHTQTDKAKTNIHTQTDKAKTNIHTNTEKITKKTKKITDKIPDIKIGGTGGDLLNKGKKGLADMTSTTKKNLTGLADAGKTGLHLGADQAKGLWTKIMDAGQIWKGEKPGSGKQSTGATQQAMGSDLAKNEKGSGKFTKGRLGSKTKRGGSTDKRKFKIRVV